MSTDHDHKPQEGREHHTTTVCAVCGEWIAKDRDGVWRRFAPTVLSRPSTFR